MSQGRQTLDGVAVRRVQVMLDDATIERAKALGDGNVSMGVRKAVKEAVMGKYIIHELQNLESVRKGDIYEGTLQGAKSQGDEGSGMARNRPEDHRRGRSSGCDQGPADRRLV